MQLARLSSSVVPSSLLSLLLFSLVTQLCFAATQQALASSTVEELLAFKLLLVMMAFELAAELNAEVS